VQTTSSSFRHKLPIKSLFGVLALLAFLAFNSASPANRTVANIVPQRAVLDFDGDNKTDYVVVRTVSGTYTWYLQRSLLGFAASSWGAPGDELVPADYDGDLKWDLATWRPGLPAVFYVFRSMTSTLQVIPFGTSGDDPRLTQDFDGDGKADPAVTRRVSGNITWYIQRSLLGFTSVTFGNSNTDAAIRGDFDGDGKADVAVYRFSGSQANTFFVLRSSDGLLQAATFGIFNGDYILPADFDGDGKTDYAVWRGFGFTPNGTWYWLRSSDSGFRALTFGTGNLDRPTPGDYDGDGTSDQAVWRPDSPSVFYVNRSSLGFAAFSFGTSSDIVPAFTLQVATESASCLIPSAPCLLSSQCCSGVCSFNICQ
jgi:spore coat protein A, manganese oxidase